jgi:ubiquinone/menaquinone biosynthesis C-methylase UbiE
MPDPYASIVQADKIMQARLADVLEVRAVDPQQRAMLNAYLSELPLPSAASVPDVGCGTGPVSRVLAEMPGVREVVGIDPSPVFVERARELGKHLSRLSFQTGDGCALPFLDASFELVTFHTTLCHVPDPEQALREAHRVLRADGWLAVFDGDYMTTTVAIDAFDPLQRAVDAMVANFVQNPWLTRRLRRVLGGLGFTVSSFRSHGYMQTTDPQYMLTIVDRGADLLAEGEKISAQQAIALKTEFFGHISFISLIAHKTC